MNTFPAFSQSRQVTESGEALNQHYENVKCNYVTSATVANLFK